MGSPGIHYVFVMTSMSDEKTNFSLKKIFASGHHSK